ncbi:MAG: sigma-54 dependent transcriptional regulator [Chitinispirillia bacterium]|jgi:DNA-binding NtrC family response regulator
MKTNIAIIDDEPRLAEILAMVLRKRKYSVETFLNPITFIEKLDEPFFDLVLTDLKMPGMTGVELLKKVRDHDSSIPVILITAHATVQNAIEAMREGAYDYIEKPFDNDACVVQIEKALEFSSIARENKYMRQELKSRYNLNNLIIISPAMKNIFSIVRKAARSPATVLISGDSGTGKEIIARAIHYYSDRVGKPFIAVNCKAFATGILESELFGHVKGAFTGANTSRTGIFERADGGTVFLDEIGEIDDNFQGKLLRVLQEREVLRVGDQKPRQINIRIVCATNRELKREVSQGRFREDLYFRLAVIPITIPPLSMRKEDILPLTRYFIQKYSEEMDIEIPKLSKEMEEVILNHSWPGNVRELENSIERALVLMRGNVLQASDLMLSSSAGISSKTGIQTLQQFLDEAAEKYVKSALEACNGVRIDAANRLGIERTTLYRLLKKYGLTKTGLAY